MLLVAVIVLILGLYIAWWGHRAERALYKLGTVIISSALGWLLIIVSIGLFIFNVGIFVGILIFLGSAFLLFYIYGDERRSTKKILKLYMSIQSRESKKSEPEILRETGIEYYRSLKWDEPRIQDLINGIFDEKEEFPTKDILDLTVWLLQFQHPTLQNTWGQRHKMAEKIWSTIVNKHPIE
jgi:hypothetical protein